MPLGLTWSCNSRANLDYDTIKSFKDNPDLSGFLVGYPAGRDGNDEILTRIKKGVTTDEMRRHSWNIHSGTPGGNQGNR